MGGDAVILHTRTYVIRKWLGFKRREMVEITAGRGLSNGPRSRRTPARPVLMDAEPATLKPLLRGPVEPVSNAKSLIESPAGNTAMMVGLSNDVGKLTTMVTDIVKRMQMQETPDIPQELFEDYMLLTSAQVERSIAVEVMKTIHRTLRPDHLSQRQFVREKIAEQLEKLLPTSGPIVRSKAFGPHVVALIGPTGVGKTTTIAKLAAKLKLEEKRKIGLITIDTFRIAATDQLRKYSEIIRAPLSVVNNPDELQRAIESMNDCDYILIDTAGRSPKDTLKLNELKNFLDAANPEEVHLVLSTTVSRECAELAIERFADVRVDKLIFTKLDESSQVGTVLNVVSAVKKPLSYVTTGQDVPADIEVARGRRIAQLILGSEL
jgi:flagellar biosynthesis protein FlhF